MSYFLYLLNVHIKYSKLPTHTIILQGPTNKQQFIMGILLIKMVVFHT